MNNFNPDMNNGSGIFGLPFGKEESKIIILPVPWELTTSYHRGTYLGPSAVFNASFQLDLYNQFYPDFWKCGIHLLDENKKFLELGLSLESEFKRLVSLFYSGNKYSELDLLAIEEINKVCYDLNLYVFNECKKIIENDAFPIVLGGDHSSPLGLITALNQANKNFGILHIDAHADLRQSYQGFHFSHASIMNNALKLDSVNHIVQLFVRDYCEEEATIIKKNPNRMSCFTDRYIKSSLYEGKTWSQIVDEVIELLPTKVYISFDIDGLEPSLCPNTGTPVPGGCNLEMLTYLFESIVLSGRKIIGADLCEVSPSQNLNLDWDANVGARALMQLCIAIAASNKLAN